MMQRRSETLYGWLINFIDRVIAPSAADPFYESLMEDDKERFGTLFDALTRFRSIISDAMASNTHLDSWPSLSAELERFHLAFPTHAAAARRLCNLHCVIGARLASDALDLTAIDVNEHTFKARPLVESPQLVWFTYFNQAKPQHSAAVFSVDDIQSLEDALNSNPTQPLFLFEILASAQKLSELPAGHTVVTRDAPDVTDASAQAFVRLAILADGKPFHTPEEYTPKPHVLNLDEIDVAYRYQQLKDLLEVLSEYNYRKDYLAKYLTLYHVVENFMFKAPVVELERAKNGGMFSIRDFRRLYSAIDKKELAVLSKLFTEVFKLPAMPPKTFEERIVDRWVAAVETPGHTTTMNPLLESLRIERRNGDILKANEFHNSPAVNFARIVYAVRNSIVHNRETEFHLNHYSLNAMSKLLLADFLFPSLEEICFYMMAKPNPYTWYSQQYLKFYD